QQNAKQCRATLASGPDGRDRYRPIERARRRTPPVRLERRPRARAPASKPWYRDALAVTSIAASTIAAMVSAAMTVGMQSASAAADRASTYQAYGEALERARGRRDVAITSAGVAAAFAGVAVFRLITRRSRAPVPAVTLGSRS